MSRKMSFELAALRDAAIDDVLVMSDAEVLAMAREEYGNVEDVASSIKAAMRETASAVVRGRLTPKTSIDNASRDGGARPSIEKIKQIVLDLFRSDQKLSLAFRDGKKHADEDWQSLYDDLVSLGAIPPSKDEY